MDIYELEEQVNELIKAKELNKAIELAETTLKNTPTTGFHKIIGRNLLHLTSDANKFLKVLYQESLENLDTVNAIYCEMNGFTINPDLWFVCGMSFTFCNDLSDTDWLADYDYFSETTLTVTGFEDLQTSYEEYVENEKWDLEDSAELCAVLITLRLLELFEKTFEIFKDKSDWTKIPVFVTSHDSELIYQTR